MQLLNTDFHAEDRAEWITMETVQRFSDHLEVWERLPGVEIEVACVVRPGSVVPKSVDVTEVTAGFKEQQPGRLGRVWLHSVILGERMALNYSG